MDQKETELEKVSAPREQGVSLTAPSDPVDPLVDDESVHVPSSKSTELLAQGRELFGRGLFQQAIHIWTRVLFIDRGNRAAKDAIEAGKKALAERQRQLDAEILTASHLVDEGKLEQARGRVQLVLSIEPRHPEAENLAARIAGLDRRAESALAARRGRSEPSLATISESPDRPAVSKPTRSMPRPAAKRKPSRRHIAVFLLATGVVFAVAGWALFANWETIVSDGGFDRAEIAAASPMVAPVVAPVPDMAELRYYNGARLFEKGRYREALEELSRVDRDASIAGRARGLVLRIEERLLRGASEGEMSESELAPGSETLDSTR